MSGYRTLRGGDMCVFELTEQCWLWDPSTISVAFLRAKSRHLFFIGLFWREAAIALDLNR
jgi:hypothetical protein